MRKYADEEKAFLREIIPGHSYAEIAELFNAHFKDWYIDWCEEDEITAAQVNSFVGRYKLNTGRNGRFPKGHEPYNKGKHGPRYGHRPTCFKKGNIPANHKPVGSTRVNADGYTEIKIEEPRKWRALHVVVWEKANGSLPKNHAVIFGDGDKRNITLENLILVSRAELVMLNKFGLIGQTAELTRTGVLLADLRMKMNAKRKQRKS